jgi:hypothetical protein
MKAKLVVGGLVLLAVVGSGYSLVGSEPAAPDAADFLITVEATGSGVNLVCQRGCAWKELSFDCGDHLPCKSPIDGLGMTQGYE